MNASSLFVWEAEPNAPMIERMAQLGLAWVVIDPAANTSENDWLSVQEGNIRRMADMPPR